MSRFEGSDPQSIAQHKLERNIRGLMNALRRDANEETRANAAEALGQLGDARAADTLIEALADPAHRVRKEAARALGKLKVPSSIEHLIRLLVDESDLVSAAAATALREFRDSQSFELLAAGITNKNRSIREAIAYLLKTFRDERAVKPLVAALKDEEWTVRCLALEALAEYHNKTAIEAIAEAIKDGNPIVRCEAVRLVGKMEDDRVPGWLIGALDDENVTFYAVDGLKRHRNQPVMEALVASLEMRNWVARRTGVETLLSWGWRPENVTQQALTSVVQRNWQEVARLGEITTEPLLAALSSGWQVEEVAKALGRVGNERTVGPLIKLIREVHEGHKALISEEIIAGSLISSLKRVIQRKAAMIAAEDLQEAVELADKTVYYVPLAEGEPSFSQGTRHTKYSCSDIRQLAHAELERRGIYTRRFRP